jgi:HlyD family secretion protein
MAKDRNPSDRLRLWLWRGLAVLLVILFFTARYLMRDVLPVREIQVTRQALVNTVSTNGRVEPETNYAFYSPIATTVKAAYVQPGDTVPKGKLLMVLDDVDARARVATAESGVTAARAAMDAAAHNGTLQERQTSAADIARSKLERDQAQHDLDALLKLKQTGAASESEVSAAQERLNTATASLNASEQSATNRFAPVEVERARAALADAQANLAAARQLQAQTAIHAPVAGTIYSLDVQPTEFAEAGTLLLQMADLNHERVRAYFDEPEIGSLAVGQKILIKWDAKQGQEWHGQIVRTPVTVVTYGTRSVGEVLVDIDGPYSGLLPKTNVTVTVTTSSQPDALSVPREALHSENGKPYVYRIVNNRLLRTPVVAGISNLTQTAILSGLTDGDWVATGTSNGLPLLEGIPIKVVQ